MTPDHMHMLGWIVSLALLASPFLLSMRGAAAKQRKLIRRSRFKIHGELPTDPYFTVELRLSPGEQAKIEKDYTGSGPTPVVKVWYGNYNFRMRLTQSEYWEIRNHDYVGVSMVRVRTDYWDPTSKKVWVETDPPF